MDCVWFSATRGLSIREIMKLKMAFNYVAKWRETLPK